MSKNTITYIVIALLVIIGGYWAYSTFVGGNSNEPVGGVAVTDPLGVSGPVDEATAQANQFIQILQNVDQVTLADLSLLSSPIFQTGLQDFGKPIEDRPVGRSNPFAPVTGLEFIAAKSQPASTTTATKKATTSSTTDLFTQ